MSRKIVFHKEYFIDFYKTLDQGVKSKFQYVFELIKQIEMVPKKFLAPMTGYEGLFEVRVEYQSNIYRVFCCFDEGKIVVLSTPSDYSFIPFIVECRTDLKKGSFRASSPNSP